MIIIHDGNADEFVQHTIGTNLCGALHRIYAKQIFDAAPYTDVVDLIPKNQIDGRYDAMIGNFARQRKDVFNPVHHYQDGHPACWRYSLVQHMECVRANANLPYYTLAPESISGTFGWADKGGALDDAIDWIAVHGVAPRSLVPQYEFNPNNFSKGWEEAAKDCIPYEFYRLGSIDMWDETMTALLNGDSVYFAVMWLAHAMNAEELQKVDGEYCIWTPNSWKENQDMLLKGRKKIFDDAFVARRVTYSTKVYSFPIN